MLYIDSPPKERWGRLKAVAKYTSLASFEAADSHPVEQHIESLRANSVLVLRNEGSLEDLYKTLDEAIRGFRKEGGT